MTCTGRNDDEGKQCTGRLPSSSDNGGQKKKSV
jgi:hypothetical protein